MRAGPGSPGLAPPAFERAVQTLRETPVRGEVTLTEIPAPGRLAPYGFACSAEVVVDDVELAGGRLVLLFDPAGQETWRGVMRLVTYVRAELEPEIALDPFLGGVGWSWLLEALDRHRAGYLAPAGTVTQASSETFGEMARKSNAEVEVRASWTPTDEDLSGHLLAWCELLCQAGGLPPIDPDVSPLGVRRRRNPVS